MSEERYSSGLCGLLVSLRHPIKLLGLIWADYRMAREWARRTGARP